MEIRNDRETTGTIDASKLKCHITTAEDWSIKKSGISLSLGNGYFWDCDLAPSDIKFSASMMPSIKLDQRNIITDVNILIPNKVVECTFVNGSKHKAICSDSDTFSLETAITVCICKYLLSGSSNYNGVVRHAVKIYNDKIKRQELEQQQQADAKEIAERKKVKKAKYQARRDKKRRDEQIAIQKEAYVQAIIALEDMKKSQTETTNREV